MFCGLIKLIIIPIKIIFKMRSVAKSKSDNKKIIRYLVTFDLVRLVPLISRICRLLDEDDLPQLSASTFLALQQFYKEQEEKENRFLLPVDEDLTLEEDWQLSQFWYDDKTTEELVDVALKAVGTNSKIALVSCPTLYKRLKEQMEGNGEVTLYEYDRRFAVFGADFTPYDYKLPLDIPRDKSSYYDLVIADPPFLSDECLTKTAVTIKFLTKNKIILCTGDIMEKMVERLLDLKKTSLIPHHRNNLANEFSCYSNFSFHES